MTLKETRKMYKLTQVQFAEFLGIPLRTYKQYEKNENDIPKIKYEYIKMKSKELGVISEDEGLLTVELIKEICGKVFANYQVEYCYLFGSYAKGKATPTSDVDLLVSTKENGLKFFGLIEDLRVALNKKVDLLNQEQIKNNFTLINEILADGIKIYG